MSANAETITRRYMRSLLWPTLATVASACLLATTLPKLELPWLALPAIAGLLWSWKRRYWQESAGLSFLAGMIYFSFAYRWFGETAGSVVGWFAPFLVLGPALLSAWTFPVTALAMWLTRRFGQPAWVSVVAALTFTVTEGMRSIGPLSNPFASVAFPQVDTPFGGIAPFLGQAGVTFFLVYTAAVIGDVINLPTRLKAGATRLGIVTVIIMLANVFAPARVVPPATTPVAIVQGNIRQELKWIDGALETALGRYVGLTSSIRSDGPDDSRRPRFVVWPETVIPTDLAASPTLQVQFQKLAASLGTTLIVGALERRANVPYNTLWFIDKDGVERIYRKRQLVPFAETLPGEKFLHFLPITRFVSHFGAGTESSVIPIADRRVAPLICWESEFPDLLTSQVRHGADVFVLSTDDAWFGETAGPYQHAQIAQMRALETGRWIVRSAATGISGIIAPNGRFTTRTVINTVAVVTGAVGDAVDTPFNHLGANEILIFLAVVDAGILIGAWRTRKRSMR